jgi:hypothetical protein
MGRVLLLVLLASVAGLFLFNHRRAEAAESRLAVVASELAGRPVRVHCQGFVGAALDVSAEAGSVEFDAGGRPSDTAELKHGVCTSLAHFTRDLGRSAYTCVLRGTRCPHDVMRSVWAVHTLAHESFHLRGERDEAVTECLALQTTSGVAMRLGATPAEARAIADYVDRHLAPNLPAEYLSPACRDGGPLDLHPQTPAWP